MLLLKQGISSSPFFVLAILLLAAGFANVLYNMFKATKSGNSREIRNGKQTWIKRNRSIFFIIAIIAIIAGLVFFIQWISSIQLR